MLARGSSQRVVVLSGGASSCDLGSLLLFQLRPFI